MARNKRSLGRIELIALATVLSCTNDPQGIVPTDTATRTTTVTFQEVRDDVQIMVFRRTADDRYTYQQTIADRWQATGDTEGRIHANLEIGRYRFLHLAFSEDHAYLLPRDPVKGQTLPEDIRIAIRPDDDRGSDYRLPSGEIWLPDAAEVDRIYHIQDQDLIQTYLYRQVSRARVVLKRGYKNSDGIYMPIPYENGTNIADDFDSIHLDIAGVAGQVSLSGTDGWYHTQALLDEPTEITPEGFAIYQGPFVLPLAPVNGQMQESIIDIELIPAAGSSYQVRTGQVQGIFERNKYLEITLWVIDVQSKEISITIDIKPIGNEKNADNGIW
jgi:hypothetical protein